MIEKLYIFTKTDETVIEKIISDENADLNHVVLAEGERLPEHYSNSNVYLIIVRGGITLKLNEQEPHSYPAGSILNIPYQTKMNVSNSYADVLEFFIIKAPSPKSFAINR